MWHCQEKQARMFLDAHNVASRNLCKTPQMVELKAPVMLGHAAQLRFPLLFFCKAIIFRTQECSFMPSICFCTIPPSLPTSQTLQEIRLRTKGARRLPQVYLRLAENVWNKAALLVTEPSGKQELEQEQTKVLDLMTPHTCSTATVVLLKRPLLIRTSSLLKNNMVMWMLAHPLPVTVHLHTHAHIHTHTSTLWSVAVTSV